jgi:precorrin-6Y C5,15-methyltransferase (decarboxylating)
MSKILVFAGTTEGRKLLETLSLGIDESELVVYACVATDYGKKLLPDNTAQIKVLSGRLTEDEMSRLMTTHQFDYVIDTTHPYAKAASENIRAACVQSGCKYIRVQREIGVREQELNDYSPEELVANRCAFFEDHAAVVSFLNQTTGNVLLTIGSKEIEKYTQVLNYQQRLFPRVLPMVEVLQSCLNLGFSGKQLLCMQGPFSLEFNIALLKQINARYLVTKDAGEAGGFLEKYEAARLTGVTLLVIGRNLDEEGSSLEEVVKFLESEYKILGLLEKMA